MRPIMTEGSRYYHATINIGSTRHYWWNLSRDRLLERVLVPFVGKQVVVVKRRMATGLLNFGSASYLEIYSTKDKIAKSEDKSIVQQLGEKDFINEHTVTEEFADEIRVQQATASSRSLLQRSIDQPLATVFVISKIGDEALDSAYDGVIVPLVQSLGLKAIRADKIEDSGKITDQILDNIASCRFVIADLSDERPNCYYEAGFAQAIGKRIIFTIRAGERVHFDLSVNRFIQWKTEADLRRQLGARLTAMTHEVGEST